MEELDLSIFRKAEFTNEMQNRIVPFEQKLKIITDELNKLPPRKRNIVLGTLLYELLTCTKTKDLERLGLLEYTKLNILRK